MPRRSQRFEELGVELGCDLAGAAPFLLGADGDRRAVLVAAGDHEHVVACGAVVASEDVGGKVGADDLTDVEGAVAVGPGDGDEYFFGHMCSRGF